MQNKEAMDSFEKPIMFPLSDLQSAERKPSFLCGDTSYDKAMSQHVKVSNRCKVKDIEEPRPLAHAIHCMIGQILDDGKQKRKQYARLARGLFTGDVGSGMALSCANK